MTARDKLVAWLSGYVDALASVNGIASRHPKFSASAFLITDGNEDIDALLSNYFREACSRLREDLHDLDIVDYRLEPVEVHFDWLRWLHQELEQRLLPAPSVVSQEPNIAALHETRDYVAWKVMEILRLVTDDFQTPRIYRARYLQGERDRGYIYVIPIRDAYLALSFHALEP